MAMSAQRGAALMVRLDDSDSMHRGGALMVFRSAIREGDYIGLDMLQQLNADLRRDITIHILLEHAEDIAQHVVLETSLDGFSWVRWPTVIPVKALRKDTAVTNPEPAKAILSHDRSSLITTETAFPLDIFDIGFSTQGNRSAFRTRW